LWSKSSYDGAGRATMDYTTDGAGGTTWSAAGGVTSDTVLAQAQTVYDADSNVIETITRQRFHNAVGTGALGTPTTGIGARVSYAAAYYDSADRLTSTVDVGTNGGTAWTRPPSAPASSATVLVTSLAYNGAGWVQDVTDPKGIVQRTLYDNLGRVTKRIRNYTGGVPGNQNDVATEYGYDGNNHVTFVQADQPGGSYQKTAYLYGVTTASGSGVNSNDILSAVQHPDPTSGQPSTNSVQQVTLTGSPTGGTFTLTFRGQTTAPLAYNADAATVQSALQALSTIGAGNALVSGSAGGPWQVQFTGALSGTYVPPLTGNGSGLTGGTSPAVAVATQQDSYQVNALGEVTQATDRNGNVHQYSYDVLGRLTANAVTTLGAGVDASVRRIEYKYDSQGNNYLITSFDAASAGNIVNQVQRSFNGLGQLTNEYQSHSGAVNTSTTPQVQYAYTEMAGGVNNSRLTSMTYPSGYVLNFNYNTGLDSNISRLSSLSDAANTLESYKYLGLDTVVERDHPQNNVNLTYIQQTGDTNAITDGGDPYTGLDRFGRVIDQNWLNGTTHTSTDRFQYGYNADSDVLYRQNLVDAAMSELYSYDNLHQLTSFQRGTLNSTHNGLVGNPSHSQSWTPDALGNFTSITTDSNTQTRTANQQNEYTSISGSGTITYDASGNITADGSGNTFVYDAWNRLVAVKNGTTTLAAYGYDGLDRRVTETHGSTTTDLYLSAANQVLEERVGGVVQARNVWSPVYVNALVLRDQSSQHNGTLDQRLYVQQDANWNVTALVDTSGNVLERYDYDPYGTVTVMSSSWVVQNSSSYNVPYGFQDMRYDWIVSMNSANERVYDPTLMRWLQTDPLGLNEGNNDYVFLDDAPITAVDPTGLQPRPFGQPESRETMWSLRPLTKDNNPSIEVGPYSFDLFSGAQFKLPGHDVEIYTGLRAWVKGQEGDWIRYPGPGILISYLGKDAKGVSVVQFKQYKVTYTIKASKDNLDYKGGFKAHGVEHKFGETLIDSSNPEKSPAYIQSDAAGGVKACPAGNGDIKWMFDGPATAVATSLQAAYQDMVVKQKKQVASITASGSYTTYLIRDGKAFFGAFWTVTNTWRAGVDFDVEDLAKGAKMRLSGFVGPIREAPPWGTTGDFFIPADYARRQFDLIKKAKYKDPIWSIRP
jgi:RHS repeat-associated protein